MANCTLHTGQDVEILSHVEGYRGGYFRCRIHGRKIERNNRVSLFIEYLDFPGQEWEWMSMYQAIPKHPRKGKFLMCRPLPPRIVPIAELHNVTGPGLFGILSRRPWQPKEEVEWLEQDVWWRVKVRSIRADGFVEVKQYWPPKGERREGEKYFVDPQRLRPALTWTEANGWTADLARVSFVNLPEKVSLASECIMAEKLGSSEVTGLSRKRTRPEQPRLHKSTLAGRLVSKSKRSHSLWTKSFQQGRGAGTQTGTAKLSLKSEENKKKLHKIGNLEWKPLLSVLGTSDGSLEESLQSYLKASDEDVELSERSLLDSIGFEVAGLIKNLQSVTWPVPSSHTIEGVQACHKSASNDHLVPGATTNTDSDGSKLASLSPKDGKVVQGLAARSQDIQELKASINTGRAPAAVSLANVAIPGGTAASETQGVQNMQATTHLFKDEGECFPRLVDKLDAHTVSAASEVKASKLNNFSANDAPQDTEAATSTEAYKDEAATGALPKAHTTGASPVSGASKTAANLATSLFKDKVLPNCDKQTSHGVTVKVHKDGNAWEVICVNYDRNGDHDYLLGFYRTLEVANAAKDAVRALLDGEGLWTDGPSLADPKVARGVENVAPSDVLRNPQTLEETLQEVLSPSDGMQAEAPVNLLEVKSEIDVPKETLQEDNLVEREKQVVSEEVYEVRPICLDAPVTSPGERLINPSVTQEQEVDKEKGKWSHTSKSLLKVKIEQSSFAELPRQRCSVQQRPAPQQNSVNFHLPVNNLPTSAPPTTPGSADPPRQGYSARAMEHPAPSSSLALPASLAHALNTSAPGFGGVVASHRLNVQGNQSQFWQLPPNPFLEGELVGSSRGEQLQGLVNTQVAGNAQHCVGDPNLHAQSRHMSWPAMCLSCKKLMDGYESMGCRVDCSICRVAYHTGCALGDGRLTFHRPLPDHKGPKVAGVYFTCGCNTLHLVLPRFLTSIADGIDTLSLFLAAQQNSGIVSPHFATVTTKLRGEMFLLMKILQNAADPFLVQMKHLMEWGSAKFMQGVHLTSEFRTLLLTMLLQFHGP